MCVFFVCFYFFKFFFLSFLKRSLNKANHNFARQDMNVLLCKITAGHISKFKFLRK